MRFFDYIKKYTKEIFIFLLILILIVFICVAINKNGDNKLEVVFLNIGQGNSTFIKSPTGNKIIIDGGPGNNLSNKISSVMPWYDRSVDLIIVSHPDKDHYEGFISFLDKYSTESFMESGMVDTSEEFSSLRNKIFSKKIPDILARRGEIIDIGGGAYIEIIFPDRNVSGMDTNNGGIVARVVYGDTSFIIQGDLPKQMEDYLITLSSDKKMSLKSDVIEVGHHGAKTSSSEEYLKIVAPKYAVISVGKENKYGHPSPETLETLEKLGIKYLRTDKQGTIVFKSDGQNLEVR